MLLKNYTSAQFHQFLTYSPTRSYTVKRYYWWTPELISNRFNRLQYFTLGIFAVPLDQCWAIFFLFAGRIKYFLGPSGHTLKSNYTWHLHFYFKFGTKTTSQAESEASAGLTLPTPALDPLQDPRLRTYELDHYTMKNILFCSIKF